MLSEAAHYRIAQTAALLLLALTVTLAVGGWLIQRQDPRPLDFAETYHAYCAQQASPAGEHVGDLRFPPNNALPYPPGTYLLFSGVGRLIGVDAVHDYALVGRTLTLLATLGAAALVLIMARGVGARWSLSVAAGGLLLVIEPVQLFAVNPRPDAVAILLTLLGFWLGLFKRQHVLAGMAFGLAIACKHSFLAAPAVVGLSLLVERRWLAAALLTAAALIAGAATAALALWCLGPHWAQGLGLQSFAGADAKQSVYFIGRVMGAAALPVGLAAGGALFPQTPGRVRWLQLYALLAFGLHALAMVKPGAAANYLLEPVAVALILAAWTVERFAPRGGRRAVAIGWTILAAALIAPAVNQANALLDGWRTQRDLAGELPADMQALLDYARRQPEPILADAAWVYAYSGHALRNFPPDLLRTAYQTGHLDPAPIAAQIAAGAFSTILLRNDWRARPFLPDEWIAELEAHYDVAHELAGYVVFEPR